MTTHSKTFVPVGPVAGASMDFAVEPVSIDAGGATLAGLFYGPKGETRAVAVLNGAVGVPQRFYRAFAEWLAGTQGIGCLRPMTTPASGLRRPVTRAVRTPISPSGVCATSPQRCARRAL